MQILEKEKTDHLWPEITLSSYSEQFLIKKKKPKGPISRNSEIIRLKSKILEYFSGALNKIHSPFYNLRIDLLGEFRFQSDVSSPFEEEGLSEREKNLLKIFFEELLDKTLEEHQADPEVFQILESFLLHEQKLDEYQELIGVYDEDLPFIVEAKQCLALMGKIEYSTSLKDKGTSRFQKYGALWKFGGLRLEDREMIYDLVVTGEEPGLLGLAWLLFKHETAGFRTVFPIERRILTLIETFRSEEKESFFKAYSSRHGYLENYFVLKRIYPLEYRKAWLEGEKRKNGRSVLLGSLQDKILEGQDESLEKRYAILKQNRLVYTLSPFELLILLNSTESSNVQKEIGGVEKSLPDSYLTKRAKAVLYFFKKDFEEFLKSLEHCGRFRFSPEMLYLQGSALVEIGRTSEGIGLLESLLMKFPDADYLRLVLERYKKSS
ncbi:MULTISPECIES: hypothetical protein [Leptospira]|uniref:Tetratricopeptide repeat protein n=1 Tax=Leptospira weilii str. UI 13098 TaxID=1088542 RepID=M6Q5K1_9LEPT|nr:MULTISPECIES: hypothetical protein [Leptospira]EMJ64093.1 hypothetical protein LEP1GSC051_4498 [Leptospira sp. P2653]EMN87983.1 hypothetical protein LEP1GSC108_0812 [Leptospira weilii str. UI 13098]MDL5247409.1 hypothetical protein [Leptospira weilii]OMI17375.1 hypothetical protein BUQ74_10330 [Leptospira weilii serovar Heyan]